jgi:anionic cell wall polymer biosynthesis LytR-Cps2A-Psr (LCP) family protein
MRRLGQALVLLVMAICAAGAAGFVVLAVQYNRFSADIHRSEAPLPATIRAVLPPSKGTLDQPQVTLVRGSGGLASGGLVLFRTVPDNGTAAFLSVPPSTIVNGVRVSRQSTPELIRVLRARLGVQVSHVAVINLGNVSRLVDGIGGIQLRNPSAVELPVSPSRTWRFPAGTLRLNGPHTAVYLRQGAPGSEQRDQAERRVLRAIVGHALEPTSVGDLQATGTAVAHSAVTDLTDADVLGLVWDRLQSRRVVQCTLPENTQAESGVSPGIVAGFLAPDSSAAVAGCRGTAIASTPYLPPKAVVVIVQHYGSRVFVVVAAAAVLMALAMAALFVRMRVRRAPAPAGPPHRPIPARAGAQITGAAGAGMRRSEELTTRAVRAGGALLEWGRSAAPRISVPRVRPPGRDSGALSLPVGALGFRARVRRFAYTHQDALWVALVAALVATMVLILLIAA